jgi:hypothetical protein
LEKPDRTHALALLDAHLACAEALASLLGETDLSVEIRKPSVVRDASSNQLMKTIPPSLGAVRDCRQSCEWLGYFDVQVGDLDGGLKASIESGTPGELARFLDRTYRSAFALRPFHGEHDYAFGAECDDSK